MSIEALAKKAGVAIDEPELDLRRHPGAEKVCNQLQAIMIGRAANDILSKGVPHDATGLVELPAWDWRVSLIEVGRKGRTLGGGSSLLLPVRRDFGEQPLLLVANGSTAILPYTVTGMGHDDAGHVTVASAPGARPFAAPETLQSTVRVGTADIEQITRQLEKLRDAGVAARWQYIMDVEPHVRKLVLRAHSHVSQEIGRTTGIVAPLLDEVGIDQAVDAMSYGLGASDLQSDGRSARVAGADSVSRLIELSLRPGCFRKVDPLKFMSTHLRRDAETRIRAMIGDPHIGPKVRRVAMMNSSTALEDIVREYRKVYPGDKLSLDRAEEAMSAAADVAARTVPLDTRGGW